MLFRGWGEPGECFRLSDTRSQSELVPDTEELYVTNYKTHKCMVLKNLKKNPDINFSASLFCFEDKFGQC